MTDSTDNILSDVKPDASESNVLQTDTTSDAQKSNMEVTTNGTLKPEGDTKIQRDVKFEGSVTGGLEAKIIRQVEYYFSDHNLPKDSFLRERIKENDGGWVTMETMIKFKRLASLATDFDVIMKALEKSNSGLLQLDFTNHRIRRDPSLSMPESLKEVHVQYKDMTVYAKGFPIEESLDSILQFAEQAGPTAEVLLCRDNKNRERIFKGSIFVTFKSKESAEKFLTMPETATFKNSHSITRQWQHAYAAQKEEKQQGDSEKRHKRKQHFDQDNEKQAEQRAAFEKARVQEKMQLGTLLLLSNVPALTEKELVFKLKSLFREVTGSQDSIAYINFIPDSRDAQVRFRQENSAASILCQLVKFIQNKTDKKDTEQAVATPHVEQLNNTEEKNPVTEAEPGSSNDGAAEATKQPATQGSNTSEVDYSWITNITGRVLNGEEEEQAWIKLLRDKDERNDHRGGGSGRGGRGRGGRGNRGGHWRGGGGYKGRGGGRDGGHHRHRDGDHGGSKDNSQQQQPPAKKVKFNYDDE